MSLPPPDPAASAPLPATPAPVRDVAWRTVWQLSRPASLSVTVVACLLGLASAAGCGIAPDWAGALVALLLACCLHAQANVLHTYHLARLSAGQPNPPATDASPFGPRSGLRLIAQGDITLTEVHQVAWALLGLVLVAGLALTVKSGGGVALLGLAGVLLAWLHGAPPFLLGRSRAGAVLCAALAWWLVVLGADYVQRRHFFLIPAVDAVSFALLVAAVALTQRGWQAAEPAPGSAGSTPRRVGTRGVALLFLALSMLAYGWLAGGVVLLYHPQQALWGLLALPLSLAASGLLWGAAQQPQRATTAWRLATAAAVLHGLGMAGGLLTVNLL